MALAQDGITVHEGDTAAFGANRPYRGLEYRAHHKPEYYLYLFNVSPRTFDPAANSGFAAGKLGQKGIFVAGTSDDDPSLDLPIEGPDKSHKYHYITSFPHPVLLSKPNLESNEIAYNEMDGRRYVIDLISPDNLTLTLDTQIPPDQVFSVGNDYSRRGIFFDYTRVPDKNTMVKAVRRMQAYYKQLLDNAANLEMTDKPKLSQELSSNPDYACAANYYGRDVTWNRMQVRPVECMNCGEQKPAGRKFHTASFGTLFIEPTVEAWEAAVNAGIRKPEDVPKKFRPKEDVA